MPEQVLNEVDLGDEVDQAWQSIAELKPRLARVVHFYQHHYRGVAWLIIADQKNESYFRCSASAEAFLTLLDGSRNVEQAFIEAAQAQPSDLQKPDIILLVANLTSSGLLQGDPAEDGVRPPPSSNSWMRPFAIKFRLFDPDRLLTSTVKYVRPLFSPTALLLWAGLVLFAVNVVILHWQQLFEHSAARFADPRNLWWYWLLYPLVKGLHEFGHAYATKVWGGRVREMGIMLLVFFPVPYVDSSAAHRFSSKSRRLLVNAAGIMVEMLLASIALIVWVNSDPGLLQDLAFDVFLIGGISTLLFNANPLLRFDGYYILSETIEIPNLGTRSTQYLGYLFKRFVLNIPDLRSPVTAAGEPKWLFSYGVCSNIYRVFISFVIAFWVAGQFLVIGLLLAVWALITQLVYPALNNCLRLIPIVINANRMSRFALVVTIFLAITLTGLLLPVGHSTSTEGVVSLPENALIRAGSDGIVTAVLAPDGASVEEAAVILTMENIELEASQEMLLARLEEMRAKENEAFMQDRSQADTFRTKVFSLAAELKDVEQQLKSLTVVSASSGLLSLPLASDMPGKFVKRGEVIGYVSGSKQIRALVVIEQFDMPDIRQKTESIEVKFGSRPAETYDAEFLRELPQGTDRLPDRLLGSNAGGDVAVDTRDESGVQLMSNIFLVEIGLPSTLQGNVLGQRIYVRFIHQKDALANRLLRRWNQFVLAPYI